MVQKAKIDLFDASFDAENSDASAQNTTIQEKAGITSRFRRFLPSGRWVPGKLFLISLVAGIVCICLAGATLWMLYDKKAGKKIMAANLYASRTGDTAYLKNFLVECMDNKGAVRIVVCDVVLLLDGKRNIESIENNPGVRNVIYGVTKKAGTALMASPANRKKAKQEIGELLNGLFGGSVIRGVCFTKLVIL